MITERTLRQWRSDSLRALIILNSGVPDITNTGLSIKNITTDPHERILRLTQELLDQHLMKKG